MCTHYFDMSAFHSWCADLCFMVSSVRLLLLFVLAYFLVAASALMPRRSSRLQPRAAAYFDIPSGATEFPTVQQSSPGTVTLVSLVGSPLSSHVPPRYVTRSTPVSSLPRDSDPNRSVPRASAGQVPTRSSEAGTTSSILLPHPTTASDSVLPPNGQPTSNEAAVGSALHLRSVHDAADAQSAAAAISNLSSDVSQSADVTSSAIVSTRSSPPRLMSDAAVGGPELAGTVSTDSTVSQLGNRNGSISSVDSSVDGGELHSSQPPVSTMVDGYLTQQSHAKRFAPNVPPRRAGTDRAAPSRAATS